MATVAEWLDRHNILWAHCPNEGKHHVSYRVKMKRLGVKPGVPDILIFDPMIWNGKPYCGTAVELKKKNGHPPTAAQWQWLNDLEARGWCTFSCQGADEAIRGLEAYGYGKTRRSS